MTLYDKLRIIIVKWKKIDNRSCLRASQKQFIPCKMRADRGTNSKAQSKSFICIIFIWFFQLKNNNPNWKENGNVECYTTRMAVTVIYDENLLCSH